MRFASKFVFVLLALATCIPALAQEKSGVFTLSYDTKWNGVVIPAGAYSISVYESSHSVSVLRPENPRQSAIFVAPVALDYRGACTNSTVSLTHEAGGWRTESVCFAGSGLTLYFSAAHGKAMVASASGANALAAGGSH